MGEPIELVTGKSDAERAAEVRAKLRPVLEEACAIINGVDRPLVVNFSLGRDQFGIMRIASIDVTKPL